jgi:hypothetical protein
MRNTIETFTKTNFTGRAVLLEDLHTLLFGHVYVSLKFIAIDVAGIALTIWIYIREVLGSNLRRNICYSE